MITWKRKTIQSLEQIDEVKKLNAESGLSYNEINEILTKEIEQKKKSDPTERKHHT